MTPPVMRRGSKNRIGLLTPALCCARGHTWPRSLRAARKTGSAPGITGLITKATAARIGRTTTTITRRAPAAAIAHPFPQGAVPGGRSKKKLHALLADALNEPAFVTIDGERRKITKREAVVRRGADGRASQLQHARALLAVERRLVLQFAAGREQIVIGVGRGEPGLVCDAR
jgi:hypothetical protein